MNEPQKQESNFKVGDTSENFMTDDEQELFKFVERFVTSTEKYISNDVPMEHRDSFLRAAAHAAHIFASLAEFINDPNGLRWNVNGGGSAITKPCGTSCERLFCEQQSKLNACVAELATVRAELTAIKKLVEW